MDLPRIRPATPTETGAVAGLIATAFHTLPASRWLVPDPHHRLEVLTATFAITVQHATGHGQVWIAGNRLAAAVWLPGGPHTPVPDGYQQRLADATGQWTDRFHTLDLLMARHHPTTIHRHLALLAVHPDHQGRGLGTALLDHTHTELDRHGTPAYLEAADMRSRALYHRHGYRPMTPFRLPDGTAFHPMWRPPAQLPATAPGPAAVPGFATAPAPTAVPGSATASDPPNREQHPH